MVDMFLDQVLLSNVDDVDIPIPPREYLVGESLLYFSEFLSNDSFFGVCERDEKGHCTAGEGGGAGKGEKGGSKGGHGEGIDIEARPFVGGGKAGKSTSLKDRALAAVGVDRGKGADVSDKGLGRVDKWLAGEGKKGPPGPIGKVVGYLGKLLGKVEHGAVAVAGAAAQYTKDKIGESTDRLPGPLRSVANATYTALRVSAGLGRVGLKAGLPAFFSIWTLPSAMSERVATNKGATPEQAKKIRTALSSIDMKALEVAKLGAGLSFLPGLGHALHFTHALATKTATFPVATTAYLAANSVRHPVHTAMAAGQVVGQIVKATAKGIASPVKSVKAAGHWTASEFKKGYNVGGVRKTATREGAKATQAQARVSAQGPRVPRVDTVHHRFTPTGMYYITNSYGEYLLDYSSLIYNADNPADTQDDTAPSEQHMTSVAEMVADALEAHDYDDWYLALFSAALDHGEKVPDAIESANAAYESQPEDPTGDSPEMSDEEAMTALYGDWIHQIPGGDE